MVLGSNVFPEEPSVWFVWSSDTLLCNDVLPEEPSVWLAGSSGMLLDNDTLQPGGLSLCQYETARPRGIPTQISCSQALCSGRPWMGQATSCQCFCVNEVLEPTLMNDQALLLNITKVKILFRSSPSHLFINKDTQLTQPSAPVHSLCRRMFMMTAAAAAAAAAVRAGVGSGYAASLAMERTCKLRFHTSQVRPISHLWGYEQARLRCFCDCSNEAVWIWMVDMGVDGSAVVWKAVDCSVDVDGRCAHGCDS
eukprot:1160573-Pelagomonas_calceolata.AAC.19